MLTTRSLRIHTKVQGVHVKCVTVRRILTVRGKTRNVFSPICASVIIAFLISLQLITYFSPSGLCAETGSTGTQEDDSLYGLSDMGGGFFPSVNLRNGNLVYHVRDVSIPSSGFPLEVIRTYNSRSGSKGIFGHGWSSNLDVRILRKGDDFVDIIEEDGAISRYFHATADGQKGDVFVNWYNPESRIIRDLSGTHTRATGEDLTEYFLPDGRLSEIRDRYGNSVTFQYNGSRLSSLCGKSGRSLTFESDEAGHITGFSDPSGRRWSYRYDNDGNLISAVMPGNTRTLLHYDASHHLCAITLADGSRQEISYDGEKNLVTGRRGPGTSYTGYGYRSDASRKGVLEVIVTDSKGKSTRYEYSDLPSGRKVEIVDPMGGRQVKVYDQFDNLISLTDGNGAVTTFRYDACNRMIGKRDAEGNVWSYEYCVDCGCRFLSRIVYPDGTFSQFTFNDKGELLAIVDKDGRNQRVAYGENGYPTETHNEKGVSTQFVYNLHGDLIESINGQGDRTRLGRDSIGRLTDIVDARGSSIRCIYDERDNLITMTGPGFSSHYQYDSLGRIVSAEDSMGRTAYSFGPEGKLTEERRADGKYLRYRYDAAGNIIQIEDRTGRFSAFEYDGNNRIASISDNLGVRFRLYYDRAGNLVKRVASAGGEELFLYDGSDHLKGYVDQAGHRLDIRTDWAGRIVSRVDELGQKIVRGYDGDGSLTEQRDSAGRSLRQVYGPAGQLALTIDGNGRISEFLYDLSGRLREAWQGDRLVKILYDTYGRPTEISDPGYPIQLGYDERGLLNEFHFPDGVSVTASYNPSKQRTSLKGPGDYYVRYDYDEDHRIRLIEAFKEASVRFTYDSKGHRSEMALSNGITAYYGYDSLGRVNELVYRKRDGSVLYHYRLRHEANGRISSMALKGSEAQFRYDPVGRLMSFSDSEGSGRTLTYDAAGNRLSERGGDLSAKDIPTIYTYGPGHRLMRRGETIYRYDKEGNRTSQETGGVVVRYVYGAANRLLRVELPSIPSVEFRYDFFGNRIERKQGQSVERYIYDGMDLIGSYDEFMRPRMEIVYGPAIDEPLFAREKGRIFFFLLDPLGNVSAMVDEKGNPSRQVVTDAFGNARFDKTVPAIALAFQSRPYDEVTGLYHFRNRDYDPVTGRFLQPDPVEPRTNLNMYTFADNDPVNYVDPTGVSPLSKYEEARKRYAQTRGNLANTELYIRKLRTQELSSSPSDRRQFKEAGGQRELERAQHVWGERKADFEAARRDLAIAGPGLPQKSSTEFYFGIESTMGLKKYTIKSTNLGTPELWVQDVRGYSPLDAIAGVSWGDSRQTYTGAKGFGNFGGSIDVDPRTGKITGVEASFGIAPDMIPQVELPGKTSLEYAPKPAKKIGDVKAKDFVYTMQELGSFLKHVFQPFDSLKKACKSRPRQGRRHK